VPAAAVIPAPIAYIKVVAVKRLVVELLAMASPSRHFGVVATDPRVILLGSASALHWVGRVDPDPLL
jgi:hypothetical protein